MYTSGSVPTSMAFRPVGEGLVPSRPATPARGRAAGDKPPPYRSDGTDAMAIYMRSDPLVQPGGNPSLVLVAVARGLTSACTSLGKRASSPEALKSAYCSSNGVGMDTGYKLDRSRR